MPERRLNRQERTLYERNAKKILAACQYCGICGKYVDKSIKYPNPLSPTVDHIIPVHRGGHPYDIDNLQLAHWICNRQKSDKIMDQTGKPWLPERVVRPKRNLPQSCDWAGYRATESG